MPISQTERFPVLRQNQLKFCRKTCWKKQPFIFTVYLMNHIFQTSVRDIWKGSEAANQPFFYWIEKNTVFPCEYR